MVQNAEAHAEEDKKRKETVEARNQADALVHSTEKNLTEYGDKVPEADKTEIETGIEQLKEALKSEDADDIKAKTETLTQASMKLGEAMYKASQESGEEGAPEGGEATDAETPDGDVVDAEFEEVDPEAAASDEKKKDD